MLSLVVIGVFTKLLLASTKGSDLTTANLLARSILDRAVRYGPPRSAGVDGWGVGGDYTTSGGRASMYTHDTKVKTKFVYQVIPTRLTPDKNVVGTLYDVRVIVTWWEDEASAQAARQEFGRLSTEVSRTVYVRQ